MQIKGFMIIREIEKWKITKKVSFIKIYLLDINFRKLPAKNSIPKLTSHEECLDISLTSGKYLFYWFFKDRVKLQFENFSSFIN